MTHKINTLLLGTFLTTVAIAQSSAATITVAGDIIGGGVLSGSTFTIGSAGENGGQNNFPAGEAPPNAIDGISGTKYLNFAEVNTGFVVTPAFGLSVVTGISFNTANDAPERDPASYALYGSSSVNASFTPGTNFFLADFALISAGGLSLPGGRQTASSIAFANALAYETYLLVFPAVKDSSANSMQIGDAVLTGNAPVASVPDTGSTLALMALSFASLGVISMYRRSAA